jgi:hypothetical protein
MEQYPDEAGEEHDEGFFHLEAPEEDERGGGDEAAADLARGLRAALDRTNSAK